MCSGKATWNFSREQNAQNAINLAEHMLCRLFESCTFFVMCTAALFVSSNLKVCRRCDGQTLAGNVFKSIRTQTVFYVELIQNSFAGAWLVARHHGKRQWQKLTHTQMQTNYYYSRTCHTDMLESKKRQTKETKKIKIFFYALHHETCTDVYDAWRCMWGCWIGVCLVLPGLPSPFKANVRPTQTLLPECWCCTCWA